MGLTKTEIELLLFARASGARFDSMLTIGRQNLYLRGRELRELAAAHIDVASFVSEHGVPAFGSMADPFIEEALGVRDLTSLDADAYEGASLRHDLNVPVPDELEESYDVVVDGGTLEHVFDVRVALSSLMRMVGVGGRLLISTPSNNLCGHGFYQFSPEFMYRTLEPSRGFQIERMVFASEWFPAIELARTRGTYEITDPREVEERVSVRTTLPLMLVVLARKLEHLREPLEKAPHQSDYVALWQQENPDAGPVPARRGGRVPDPVLAAARGARQLWRYRLGNRRFFKPLNDPSRPGRKGHD